MIMRGPITPWEYGAARGHPVSTPYEYEEIYLTFKWEAICYFIIPKWLSFS